MTEERTDRYMQPKHEEPLVSIMIPLFNAETYLPQCLDSVRNQSYENYEAILLDDGSTDCSPEICEEYAAHDDRFRVLHIPNGGLGHARNVCLAHARGGLLVFLDADDWIEPQTVQVLVDALLSHDADMVCCQYYKEWISHSSTTRGASETLVFEGSDILKAHLRDRIISIYAWGKIYRTSLFEDLRYDRLHLFEDIPFMARLCSKARKVVCIPDPLFHYRVRATSLSHASSVQNLLGLWYAYLIRREYILSVSSDYEDILSSDCMFAVTRTWRRWFSCPASERRAYRSIILNMRDFAREHMQEILCGAHGIPFKIQCLACNWASPTVWIPLHLADLIAQKARSLKKGFR